MNLRPPRSSLILTLALAYLGLALAAALAVAELSLSLELGELDHDLRGGRLQRATAEAADQIAAELPNGLNSSPVLIRRELDAALRSVEQSFSETGDKGVLSELGHPIAIEVRDVQGRVVAHAGAPASPRPTTSGGRVWRGAAPLRTPAGAPEGQLVVALTRQPPGLRALVGEGFEWPALVVYAAVFGLGSALVLQLTVTRRLRAIAHTADAWSGGDFSHSVADASDDEIGQLSRRLDEMARQLEVLVALKAEVAGLGERQRLARDLHDTVKQKAFALQLQLAAAGRSPSLAPDVARTLEDARGITREIQEELAHLIGEPPAASSGPFDQLLAQRAEAWGRRGGFEVRVDLAAANKTLAQDRLVLIRVLDEALANVMRHGGAEAADVRLSEAAGRFVLVIEDNGRGLGRFAEGMGLRNMRRRAAELPQGSLTVESAAKGGVRVTLSWIQPMTTGT